MPPRTRLTRHRSAGPRPTARPNFGAGGHYRSPIAPDPTCRPLHQLDRRQFLGVAAAGVLGALAACSPSRHRAPASGTSSLPPGRPVPPGPLPSVQAEAGRIPAAHPGPPVVVSKAPRGVTSVALTIDDGFCASCVSAYVDFAESSGTPITFSPNGAYRDVWDPHAPRLRSLVAAGQVQIGNHTWTHKRLTGRSDGDVESDIRRNEEWIEDTFGVTARPWFRPPYGVHNKRTDALAGDLGYTKILLWNGTFGDATPISAGELLKLADRYLKPGTIMLGHANHPTVTHLFPELLHVIRTRDLQPVTLDTMFGTSRTAG